ncbi:MAG: glycosyltransferase family 2 protein, partial [Nitriliruptor sp.]
MAVDPAAPLVVPVGDPSHTEDPSRAEDPSHTEDPSRAEDPARTEDPDRDGDVDITVVLPVYNEAAHLRAEVERITAGLAAAGKRFEILAVDDGSTDGSAAVLDELEAEGAIRLFRLPRNRGSGYARRIGTEQARGEVVVWTDADMTYPNHEMAALVDQLEGGWDQVVGARTSEQGTHRWARVPAKFLIRKLASYLVKEPIPDLNSGFRAFRRSVALPYLHLLPTGFSCVTTITLAFLANAHLVHYVPIEYAERAGTSKFHWRRDTARYLQQVVRMVMTFNPLRVFLPLGGGLFAGSIAKFLFDIVDKGGRITTNTVILVIVSLQI